MQYKMDNPVRVSEDQQNNSKGINMTCGQSPTFTVQMSVCQALFLNSLLPKSYSMQIQRQTKSKRNLSKKKNAFSRKSYIETPVEEEEASQRIKKTVSTCRESEEFIALNNYSRAASQAYPEQVDDTMKPCLRILQALKNHKSSWPFKDPVDPIILNIPNYFEIIKQPMDLQKIQKNIKGKMYLTPSQFHADIKKIINNSNQFNRHNPDYLKLTSDFQQCYQKICSDQANRNNGGGSKPAGQSMQIKKKKSKSNSNQFNRQLKDHYTPTLAQKKNLALQIKRLPQQYLAQIAQIIYQGRTPTSQQVNIQLLPAETVRQLQRLVNQKMAYVEVHTNNERQQKNQPNQNQFEESSFDSDSDS